MHIYVPQVCIIEPSFFNATLGMDRRHIEGRHLVTYLYQILLNDVK